MNDVFFTADTHVGHSNIIKYCNRPFNSPEAMEEALIYRLNSIVKKGDRLYHLGDVSWSSYDWDKFFGRLNTKQVYLIEGNHDPKKKTHPNIVWRKQIENMHMPGNAGVTLCHYPMLSWPTKSHGGYHLFGHVHGKLQGAGRSMDVGVDTNNFYPYSWEDIVAKLSCKPFYAEEAPEKKAKSYVCPTCVSPLVAGEDQYEDAWICPKCNKEVKV